MLTDMQKIVLSLVVAETKPIVAAGALGITKAAISDHLTHIYKKFGILNGERGHKLISLRLKARKNPDIQAMCLEGEKLFIARKIIQDARAASELARLS